MEAVGSRVVRHPWIALAAGGLPMLLLALQASRLRTGPVRGDWLPSNPESVRAVQSLEDMGRGNVVQTLRVLVVLPQDAPVGSPEGWTATRRLAQTLERDPRIARVHSAATDAAVGITRARLKELEENGSISRDQRSVLFEVLPAVSSSDPMKLRADAEALARSLQASDAAALTGLRGAALDVGGLPAINAQFEDAISGRLESVVYLVMVVTFFALFFGFRSLLVAAKAVALNLLTVAAAFGALVLVFQEGHGVELFGLDGGTGRVFTIVPILAFCVVFGLSMDYEVFLVSRVAEARRSGLSEDEAIVEGLARTASVITSAGSIMIAVFAAFAMGAFLPIQMLGFVLTVAVLLDATVVRMVIGPALLRLAGRWNWWPGESRFRPKNVRWCHETDRGLSLPRRRRGAFPSRGRQCPARPPARRRAAIERGVPEGAAGRRHRRPHEALRQRRRALPAGREGGEGPGGDPLQVEVADGRQQDLRDGAEQRALSRIVHGFVGMGERLHEARAQERQEDPRRSRGASRRWRRSATGNGPTSSSGSASSTRS